ncbi:MAG: T9SS type A sorting domain-containing protein [Bacteroidia bacterium]
MKTTIITAAIIMSVGLLSAQTEKKQATVRIKKIENINGVEKITDTTYTTDDATAINAGNESIQVIETGDGKKDEMKKIVIVNGNAVNGDEADIKIINNGEGMDEEIAKALKEAGVDPNTKGVQKMIMVHDDATSVDDKTGEKKCTKIVMIKNIKITDADASDIKKIDQQAGSTDGKLAMDNMKFYPNPNNGKFNLSFNLQSKGDAEITVLNIEGKKVYSEKLPNFTGAYDKEIDISKNPKGVYFVRIEQGKHAQVKKVMLD